MKPRFGFNLLDMFVEATDTRYPHMFPGHEGKFRAEDFAFIARTGFDYVRLPLCYRNWIRNRNPLDIDPEKLTPLDRAVELGLQHGIHVSINLHHAPGFCINHPIGWGEPFNLWKDSAGLEAFLLHWTTIAERFKGVDPDALSFNLVNEPPPVGYGMSREDYVRVMTAATRAIHAVEPERPVVVDGINVGIDAVPEMLDEPVTFGCRGYLPFPLTHYLAEWGPGTHTRVPKWPFVDRNGTVFDRDDFYRVYKPWFQMQRMGAKVHCGEFGCHHKTPHPVALAWMEDLLSVLNENNIGFAMWNFRGSLGIADSGREDVVYKNIDGYQVDTQMLELLQRHI